MTLAFDTFILIDIEKRNHQTMGKLKELSEKYPLQPPFISYFELLIGLKVREPRKHEEILAFLNKFNVLQTTNKCASILADLKIRYDNSGITLNLSDLLIASQILENQPILVTKDKDFDKIKEIKKIIL